MTNKKAIKKSRKQSFGKVISLKDKVQSVYNHINLSTTCPGHCVCCNVACPQMNHSEFLVILDRIYNDCPKELRLYILKKSIKYFFSQSIVKPCPLLEGKHCSVYSDRPLSCFLPDTWIFTNKGPKYIKDIMAGDYVLGIDGGYHIVRSTRSKIYNGEILNIRPKGHNIECWVTPEHLWHVISKKDKRSINKPLWTPSEKLVEKKNKTIGTYLSIPKIHQDVSGVNTLDVMKYIDGSINEVKDRVLPFTSGKLFEGKVYRSIPREFQVNDDFLFMLGIYLAEGSATSQSVAFCMHSDEKHYLEKIRKYLDDLLIPSHFIYRKNNVTLRVDSCLFARLMSSLCGKLAENKSVNDDLFSYLSSSQLMKIYEAWNIGDGRKLSKEKEYATISISEKLVLQMYVVLLRNNIIPRLYKYKRGNRGFASFELHVFPSNFRDVKLGQGTRNIVDDNFIYSPLDNVEKKLYCGAVYDLDVEGVESFVTSSGVAHNCRMYGLWPSEVYEERVTKFIEATGLKREEIPLNTQCMYVKRVDESQPLTKEVIDGLYQALNDIDVSVQKYTPEQISKKYNQRTWHDWFMVTVFGEDNLADMSKFFLAAPTQEVVDSFVEEMMKQVDLVGDRVFKR